MLGCSMFEGSLGVSKMVFTDRKVKESNCNAVNPVEQCAQKDG